MKKINNIKIIVILSICFFNIILLSSTARALIPYGPKIMGLQLGMDYKIAKKAIDDIASRYKSKPKVFINSYKNGNKEICIYGLIVASLSKDGKLYRYNLSVASTYLFNTPSYHERRFLQNFIDHYNIPRISFRNGFHGPEYYYIDYDKHWGIIISKTSIDIFQTNQKSPNYNFN